MSSLSDCSAVAAKTRTGARPVKYDVAGEISCPHVSVSITELLFQIRKGAPRGAVLMEALMTVRINFRLCTCVLTCLNYTALQRDAKRSRPPTPGPRCGGGGESRSALTYPTATSMYTSSEDGEAHVFFSLNIMLTLPVLDFQTDRQPRNRKR